MMVNYDISLMGGLNAESGMHYMKKNHRRFLTQKRNLKAKHNDCYNREFSNSKHNIKMLEGCAKFSSETFLWDYNRNKNILTT